MKITIEHNSFLGIHIPDQKVLDMVPTPIGGSSASIYSPMNMDALAESVSAESKVGHNFPHFSTSQQMELKIAADDQITDAGLVCVEIKNSGDNVVMTSDDWETIFDISSTEFVCAPTGSLYLPSNSDSCIIPQAIKQNNEQKILSYSILFWFKKPNGEGPYYGKIDPLGKVSSDDD